jgi:cytochrome c-type biogenesis protein CcmH
MHPMTENRCAAASRQAARPTLIAIGVLAAVLAGLAVLLHPPFADRPTAGSEPASLTADDLREIGELPQVAARLRERLGKSAGDPDGWALLARTYLRLGEPVLAKAAFQRALALRGNDAAVLVDYADTLAFLNHQSFEGEPRQLIERALQIDPAYLGALMLAGLAAFDRHEYVQAVTWWEKAVAAAGPGSPVAEQALAGIAEARKRAGPAFR